MSQDLILNFYHPYSTPEWTLGVSSNLSCFTSYYQIKNMHKFATRFIQHLPSLLDMNKHKTNRTKQKYGGPLKEKLQAHLQC